MRRTGFDTRQTFTIPESRYSNALPFLYSETLSRAGQTENPDFMWDFNNNNLALTGMWWSGIFQLVRFKFYSFLS